MLWGPVVEGGEDAASARSSVALKLRKASMRDIVEEPPIHL